jgi:P27 family predicted phage terminase small subunit
MPQRKHTPELKLLHGVEPNELVDTAPKPAHREPKRPTDLSVVERRLWDEVTAELRDMDTLVSADAEEILTYVRMLALTYRLHGELGRTKTLTSTNVETGVTRAHPLIAAFDRAVGRAHVLASALGLNPHGRSLIHGRTSAKPNTEGANIRDLYA